MIEEARRVAKQTCDMLNGGGRITFIFKDMHDMDDCNGLEVIDSGKDSEGRDTLFLVYEDIDIIVEKDHDDVWKVVSLE